jgi:hypothetical protein
MTRQCCRAGRASGRPARLSKITASILPAVVLALLPKCPLCLAAWLTVATGVSIPAAGVAWVRRLLVVFCVAALAVAAAPIVRRLRSRSVSRYREAGATCVSGRRDIHRQIA